MKRKIVTVSLIVLSIFVINAEDNLSATNKDIQKTETETNNLPESDTTVDIFDLNNDGITTTSSIFNNKNLSRRYYDENDRLTKLEIWNVGKDISSYILSRCIIYTYKDDNPRITSSTDIDYTSFTKIETNYDDKGNVIKKDSYFLSDTENTTNVKISTVKQNSSLAFLCPDTSDFSWIRKSLEVYQYDNKNRVIDSLKHLYKYDEEYNITSDNTYHIEYDFMGKGSDPDYKEYQNDNLKKTVTYIDKNSYTQILYFKNDYEIESLYNDNTKTSEKFIQSGKILRSVSYEK